MPKTKENSNNNESYTAEKNNKKAEKHEANKKAAKVAAKAAADYFTGGKGGAVVDKLAQTKLGDKVLNKGAKALDKIPGMGKTTKKLNDSGTLDAADKGLSALSGGKGGGMTKTSSGGNAGQGSIKSPEQNTSTNGESGNSSSGKMPLGGLGKSPFGKGFLGRGKGLFGGGNSSENESGDSSGSANITAALKLFSGKKKIMIIAIGVGGGFIFLLMLMLFTIIGSSDDNASGEAGGSANRANGSSICGAGTCNYEINGLYNGGRIYKVNASINNLKVRLMNCSNSGLGTPVQGEELVDFEKYVLGVVYAEIGDGHPESPTKVQAIAARSYSLVRPYSMGNSAGLKLSEENGQWILQIRNCTEDQVYCDPDQGCSNTTLPSSSGNSTTVYSGANTKQYIYKEKLAEDSKIRQWVAETSGEVVVNSSGQIISTNFVSTDQGLWETTYKNLDYKQVLLQYYNQGNHKFGASEIKKMSCSGGGKCNTSTGDYTSWLQYGQSWSSIPLGNSDKTIETAGCLVTSIAMLIAKSGVTTNIIGEFNPGTFVEALNEVNSFGSSGDFSWNKTSEVAPNFVYQNSIVLSGKTKTDKINTIKNIADQGYYIVAEVKGNTGQHWVAIDSINGENITMMDPGSESTDMWQEYNWNNTSRISFFKAN